jgi:hypothetical protein
VWVPLPPLLSSSMAVNSGITAMFGTFSSLPNFTSHFIRQSSKKKEKRRICHVGYGFGLKSGRDEPVWF